MSHLLQMRGLKRNVPDGIITILSSHLLQMRGLKLTRAGKGRNTGKVASFTDAWIETGDSSGYIRSILESHLLQMRGLKLIIKF